MTTLKLGATVGESFGEVLVDDGVCVLALGRDVLRGVVGDGGIAVAGVVRSITESFFFALLLASHSAGYTLITWTLCWKDPASDRGDGSVVFSGVATSSVSTEI